MNHWEYLFDWVVGWVLLLFGVLLVVVGVITLGDQVISYLKTAYWRPYSAEELIVPFFYFDEFKAWYEAPMSWLGLQKMMSSVLNFLPLTITSFILGVIFCVVGYHMKE